MLIRDKMKNFEFSYSERVVVDYILERKTAIKNMTVKEIGNAVHVSPSILIRIAHKLGYEGWQELKDTYLKEEEYFESHFVDIDANIPFEKNDNIMSVASKIANLRIEAINDTLSLITHDDLQKATRIIRDSEYINIFAISSNGYIAHEFKSNMDKIHKFVNISNVQGELVYAAALAKPQSCAIIISYSGETVILGRVINALKENHIPIIAITSVGDNTLVRNSDCILKMCTREKLYSKIANFTTDSAISYLLDVLYSCVFKLDYDKNLKYKIDIAKKIENSRYTTNEILKEKGEEYFY